MSRYAKSIIAFLGALGTWGATAAADGNYDQIELWALCGVLATAVAVFQIPNRPPRGKRRKPSVSETAEPIEP